MQSKNPTSDHPGDCTVVTFDANWHHDLGRKLEVFPRSLPLAGEVFWPDLASFLEDHHSRQMIYFTPTPNPWSAQVIFHERERSWSLAVFHDAELLNESSGNSLVTVSRQLAQEMEERRKA